MTNSVIQHSFHAGEWAPHLYARVDLAKYKAGAAFLENFFVDYRGGASTRAGTAYVATAINSNFPVRLIPFQASNSIGYILEFGQNYMRPIANSAPIAFTLATPYTGAEVGQLKFTQLVDRMFICHPSHAPQVLTLIAPNNWTIGPIPFGTSMGTPALPVLVVINPGTANYAYCVTAVNANGEESQRSPAPQAGANMAAAQYSTINVTWAAVAGATSYNVYRSPGAFNTPVVAGTVFGFIANTDTLSINDSFRDGSPQTLADFSITPPVAKNPFAAGENPKVPGLHQQRLVLANTTTAVQTFHMSQTGSYYNFDIHNPLLADDAVDASIVSGQLNEIKSMISVPLGLMMLTSNANWLISSGSGGSAISPIDVAANQHSQVGANDMPPIVANFDILFVQNKNSMVRDLAFNFYTQVFTGTDISVLSSHLFYGFNVLEWAWAEEPLKTVWAVRDDGIALTLTFLKEQELIGWTHSITDGTFKSVATITELTSFGNPLGPGLADVVYFVVERIIGGTPVKYIESLRQRNFPAGTPMFAWCVDSAIRYSGAPTTAFAGWAHLAGKTVTGLADGVPITPFVMPGGGNFNLPVAASVVTVGLPYTCKLQTLPLDTGEPTIQGKRKAIGGVTVRVQDTLGLEIGKDFDSTVVMKDLVIGNVGSATDEVVTQLVSADARTIIDPSWDVPGQYCIQQKLPYPASVLGVIPEIELGDTEK